LTAAVLAATLAIPGVAAPAAVAATVAAPRSAVRYANGLRRQLVATFGALLESPPAAAASDPPVAHAGAAPAVPAAPVVTGVCKNVDLVPRASNLAAVDAATLCLVNKARQAAGLVALVDNADLTRAAAAHSADMVANDYFSHVGLDGLGPQARALAAGFAATGRRADVAENIAAATMSGATPAEMVATWMSSPGHRANILDPAFRFTGLGVTATVPALLGTQPGGTYTEDFA
jgi:uncharacterized protein YkwD